MKILKKESLNRSIYENQLEEIKSAATFHGGPGFELIGGSPLYSALQHLLSVIPDSSEIEPDRMANYIEATKHVINMADELSAKAVMLHQAAKAAKELAKQIKSDIEEQSDNFISLED